ncbi:hypothetical protein D6B98_15900 [Bradyrhizobium sp. LVM 105]|nr:hypothetical protein D6B98_15900 [Bradyrhizobium sp. LVM 105]
MAKTPTDIRSLARGHTEGALATLASIMHSEEAAPAARVAAANALLDRGWGKPAQPVDGDGEGGPVSILHKIERVIVQPSNSDG